MLRDTFLPLASFYAGWKLVGLAVGIAIATAVGAAIVVHERRRGRPAAFAGLALGLVFIRAAVGLLSGSAKLYLAQDVLIDTLLGTAFLVSLQLGRPITALLSEEMYPLPAEVRETEVYAETFKRITRAWVVYFYACASVRLAALLILSADAYVVVSAVTGAPFIIALLVWSVRHAVRSFRAALEAGAVIA